MDEVKIKSPMLAFESWCLGRLRRNVRHLRHVIDSPKFVTLPKICAILPWTPVWGLSLPSIAQSSAGNLDSLSIDVPLRAYLHEEMRAWVAK